MRSLVHMAQRSISWNLARIWKGQFLRQYMVFCEFCGVSLNSMTGWVGSWSSVSTSQQNFQSLAQNLLMLCLAASQDNERLRTRGR